MRTSPQQLGSISIPGIHPLNNQSAHFAKDTLVTSASGRTSSLVSSKVLEGSGSGASTGADVSAGFSDGLSDVSNISIFSGEDDGTGLLGSSMRSSSSRGPFLSSAFVAFLQEGFDRVDLGSGAAFGAAASTSVTLTVTVTGGLTCGVDLCAKNDEKLSELQGAEFQT